MKLMHYYQGRRLATVVSNDAGRSVFQCRDQLLSECGQAGNTMLLAVDAQRSTLCASSGGSAARSSAKYTPYGHGLDRRKDDRLMGYAGELLDTSLNGYLLGSGYRFYMPTYGRFNSPDTLSPFGPGGLNAYAYCGGDPINRADPSGHLFKWVVRLLNRFKKNNHSAAARQNVSVATSPERRYKDMGTQTDEEDLRLGARLHKENERKSKARLAEDKFYQLRAEETEAYLEINPEHYDRLMKSSSSSAFTHCLHLSQGRIDDALGIVPKHIELAERAALWISAHPNDFKFGLGNYDYNIHALTNAIEKFRKA